MFPETTRMMTPRDFFAALFASVALLSFLAGSASYGSVAWADTPIMRVSGGDPACATCDCSNQACNDCNIGCGDTIHNICTPGCNCCVYYGDCGCYL
jgi:hypothetical protein